MTHPPAPRPDRSPARPRGRIAVVASGAALAVVAGLALAGQLPAWLVAPRYADEVAGGLVGAAVAWGAYRWHRRPDPPRPR